jgi:glycosyltransferase involved in cell wall biosynthesis
MPCERAARIVDCESVFAILWKSGLILSVMSSPAPAPIETDAPAQKQRRMKVFVHLAEEFGTRRWRKFTTASHSSGIVDRLPYGYYRAADENCSIEYSENFDEWRAVRLARLAARRLLGFDLLHAWRNRRGILDADIVWTHTELEHLAVVLLFLTVPRARRPKLIAQSVWMYDRWPQFSRPKRWLFSKLLAQADLLTVLSPENQRIARQLFPHKRVEFVRFGIDNDSLSIPALRKSGPVIRVLALGRDMHRDWETLIKAVAGWEGCEVRIGAKTIDRKAVAEAGNISLVSPASNSDISELYRWADVFVLPLKPNFHASGITVLEEAALFGVPVIGTDTGGLRAYFSEDEVRYVPPRDTAALRAAIEELGKNDRLRYDMAKRAQERMVRDNLTSQAYALLHKKFSEELLGDPFR